LPKYEGTISIQGIIDTVSVFTDDYGIPHVFAENENDLFIVAGYIAARERLFQMSLVSSIHKFIPTQNALRILYESSLISSVIFFDTA